MQGLSTFVCQAVSGETQASTKKVYQQCLKEWAGWYVRVPDSAIFAPKLVNVYIIV